MTRPGLGLLMALSLVLGCSVRQGGPAPSVAPPVECASFTVPAGAAGAPPPAILADLAGPIGQVQAGVPGGPRAALPKSVAGGARITPAGVLVSASAGTRQSILRLQAGACREVVGGALDSAAPDGSMLVANQAGHRYAFDASGKRLADVGLDSVYWTRDGHLLDAHRPDLRIIDRKGAARTISVGTANVLATLGDEALGTDGQGTVAFNLDTGAQRRVSDILFFPIAGSPDGGFVAGVDQKTGTGSVVDSAGKVLFPIHEPGPILAFFFSPDSRWLAVDTRFGGLLIHLPDGATTDLGPVNVSAW